MLTAQQAAEIERARRVRTPSPEPSKSARRTPREPPHAHEESLGSEQLARLDAIVRGAEKPEKLEAKSPALSDVSTAPSPGAALAWASFSSEACDESLVASPVALSPSAWRSSYPSLGSAGHADRTCRPCAFARSTAGCKFGAECNFCHLVAEHPESVRMRPCKGERWVPKGAGRVVSLQLGCSLVADFGGRWPGRRRAPRLGLSCPEGGSQRGRPRASVSAPEARILSCGPVGREGAKPCATCAGMRVHVWAAACMEASVYSGTRVRVMARPCLRLCFSLCMRERERGARVMARPCFAPSVE